MDLNDELREYRWRRKFESGRRPRRGWLWTLYSLLLLLIASLRSGDW